MKLSLLAVVASGLVVGAQEKTETISPKEAKTVTTQTKAPQQTRKEQTTQIITNTDKGNAPTNYQGAGTVDEDLRQRVKVALSTGSVGTQGVIASDQLTDIQVAVTNCIVTLSGNVKSEKSKQTIAKRVAGLDGVQSVNNNLTVNPKANTRISDLTQPDGYSPGTKDVRTQDARKVPQPQQR